MVERFFAEITRKRIRRGVFKSVAELEQAIYDYLAIHITTRFPSSGPQPPPPFSKKPPAPSKHSKPSGREPSVRVGTLEGRVPDAKTVWLYREQLTQAGVIEALFETFDGYLKDQGYLAMGGQIIDASIVAVSKQRNSREENARIKAGETPAGWEDKPAKRRQKDVEARWTKKHGKSHYGYKNHVNVDRRHKLVRRYHVSDAAEHDSQVLDDILDGDNTALAVWADSAYRSAEIEAALKEKGLRSRIHRKGRRNKPLSEREKQGNKTRSSVRVRVEHVFGAQGNDMGGTLVRSVGLVRAKARIGLKNLAYNMRRLVQLERLAAAV